MKRLSTTVSECLDCSGTDRCMCIHEPIQCYHIQSGGFESISIETEEKQEKHRQF